jgi:hypothetical protein
MATPITQTNFEKGVRTSLGMGWANYADTLYTAGSPLIINNARTKLTCDGLGAATNKVYLPDGVTDFWDAGTNKLIAPRVGDSFEVRINFTASASNQDYFNIEFDIGAPVGVVSAVTLFHPKTAALKYSVSKSLFSLSTFITNGCEIYFNTTLQTPSGANVSFYDIEIFVRREFTLDI